MVSPATLLRSGEVLGGYRVDEVLGIGGMAVVYRAQQLSLGRPVALKVLSRDVTHDHTFRERFRREAHHAATLEHPHIVPVYDTGEDAGYLYIAMRLIEGGTLADRVHGTGLSPEGTVRILRPLAGALDAAHGLGLVHRDIKPENILLARDEHPYLGDFGVAKGHETRGLTAAGGFVGTVQYASPEQIRAEPLTSASDIYSFTAMAFECLTGEVPYPKETDAGVMHAHLEEPPPRIAVAGLPAAAALQDVIVRGMAKEPRERFPSATAFIDAVGAAISTLPEPERERRAVFGAVSDDAPPPPPPERGATRLVPRRIEPPGGGGAAARREQERAERVWLWSLAGAVTVALALPLLALLHSPGGDTGGLRVAHGSLVDVTYGPPWVAQPAAAATPLLGLDIQRPAALSTAGATGRAAAVRAGRLQQPSAVPAGLPDDVVTRFANRPKATTVRVGGAVGRRYDGALTDSGSLTVLVVATDRGDVAVGCERPAGGAAAGRLCDGILGSARLVGARALPPGPDPELARGLNEALSQLALARTSTVLSDTNLSGRAASLRALADATSRAAADIDALKPRSADRPAVRRAAAALLAEARALQTLANAAQDRLASSYDTSSVDVENAQRQLRDALQELRRRGYRFASNATP